MRAHRKIVFVLESPPKSGLYFYKPGAVSEPLFSAMMKDVLEIKPQTKEEGLSVPRIVGDGRQTQSTG